MGMKVPNENIVTLTHFILETPLGVVTLFILETLLGVCRGTTFVNAIFSFKNLDKPK